MILSFATKAVIVAATVAAATTGTVVLVKKNEKVGKLYEDKMPEFFKNSCKKVETVAVDGYRKVADKVTEVKTKHEVKKAAQAIDGMHSKIVNFVKDAVSKKTAIVGEVVK